MKKYFITLLVFTLYLSASAQKYYHFMEKNTIGYSNTVFHTMDVLSFKYNKHTFTLQRVLNARTTLLFNYSMTKAKCRFGYENAPTLATIKTDQFGRTTVNEGYHVLTGKNYYQVKGFELGMRKFILSKGSLAPYGTFVEMKLGYENLTNNPNDSLAYYNSNGYRTYEKFSNIEKNNLTFVNFVGGVGSTKPIAKNISFTWLMSMTLPIGFWGNQTTQQLSTNGYREIVFNSDEYFLESSKMTHIRNNVLNISLGLNYSF